MSFIGRRIVCIERNICAPLPRTWRVTLLFALAVFGSTDSQAENTGRVAGPLKKWQPLTVTFSGPELSEEGKPSPFTHFRLDVTFQKGDRRLVVPGYYAADGNA